MNAMENTLEGIFESITPYECALMSYLSYYEKQDCSRILFTRNMDTRTIIRDNRFDLNPYSKDLYSRNLVFLFFGIGYTDIRTINDQAACYLHEKGWEFYEENILGQNGYKGIAFINHQKQKIVIAHRGTIASNINNIQDDIEILKGENGNVPTIFTPALSFVKFIIELRNISHSSYQILQTGHSLGGFLAECCTAYVANPVIFGNNRELRTPQSMNDANAITVDSLGSVTLLERIGVPTNRARIKNYLPFPNMVNTANRHAGERILLSNTINETEPTVINVRLGFEESQNFDEIIRTYTQHQLIEIIPKFDPQTGYPHQQRIVIGWPIATNTFTVENQAPIHPTNNLISAGFAFMHAYTGGITMIHHARTGMPILRLDNEISNDYVGNNPHLMMPLNGRPLNSENSTSPENNSENRRNQPQSSTCNQQ